MDMDGYGITQDVDVPWFSSGKQDSCHVTRCDFRLPWLLLEGPKQKQHWGTTIYRNKRDRNQPGNNNDAGGLWSSRHLKDMNLFGSSSSKKMENIYIYKPINYQLAINQLSSICVATEMRKLEDKVSPPVQTTQFSLVLLVKSHCPHFLCSFNQGTYKYMYVYIYACIYICVYIYKYIYI